MERVCEAVIGLEVHCQLSTDSKAFSPDSAAYGAEPNRNVDPVSLGHPGTLPVFNERAVVYAIRMGLATHCEIAGVSVFARKHYFYPDLPKGYQISQSEYPICSQGFVEIESPDGSPGRIRILRIHLEEDAGKSIHDRDSNRTLLDYNRCGVPLIEIVSEPDLRTPAEAVQYLRKVRQLVRYLGICDGNMEEGSLRCDANVSVRPTGSNELGNKTEIKNLNSFRHVEHALEYEIVRQTKCLSEGHDIVQETRLWDHESGITRSMRSKEDAHDYRYFPDPDLPPVTVVDEQVDQIRASLPELPESRIRRYRAEWNLPVYDAKVITEERELADFFESCVKRVLESDPETDPAVSVKMVSNFVMTHVLRSLKELGTGIDAFPISPQRLAGLVILRLADRISSTAAQCIFDAMLIDPAKAESLAFERNLLQVRDVESLAPFVDRVLSEHADEVESYMSGKAGLIGFFVGKVMQAFTGSADPRLVRTLIEEKLEAKRNV